MPEFTAGDILYRNALAKPEDVADFVAEGDPVLSFPQGAMRLENGRDPAEGQAANYLFWCPEIFPANFQASWSFRPLREPGLAMFWFAAAGRNGEDLFDASLAPRAGEYRQYHHGDINAYHLSYFRRKQVGERRFHTCNLRKSYGFHLLCQGGDPIPSVPDVDEPYRIEVTCCDGWIRFRIDALDIFTFFDDGQQYGPLHRGGRIGFRQMAPLIAEYSDLVITNVSPA